MAIPDPLRCPRCKKGEMRLKVELFLDIPVALMHRLSKTNLRRKDVKLEGANWPREVIYCTECGMPPETRSPGKGRSSTC